MKFRTVEDGYQYRIHHILRKFAKDMQVEDEFETDADEALWKYRKEIGEYFVNDISDYCGIQDAYNEND